MSLFTSKLRILNWSTTHQCKFWMHSFRVRHMRGLPNQSELHTRNWSKNKRKIPGARIKKKKKAMCFDGRFPMDRQGIFSIGRETHNHGTYTNVTQLKIWKVLLLTLCSESRRIGSFLWDVSGGLVNMCDRSDIVNPVCLWCITILAGADGAILYVHVPQHSLRFPFVWHNSLCL